jgi:hypothetical protein
MRQIPYYCRGNGTLHTKGASGDSQGLLSVEGCNECAKHRKSEKYQPSGNKIVSEAVLISECNNILFFLLSSP